MAPNRVIPLSLQISFPTLFLPYFHKRIPATAMIPITTASGLKILSPHDEKRSPTHDTGPETTSTGGTDVCREGADGIEERIRMGSEPGKNSSSKGRIIF